MLYIKVKPWFILFIRDFVPEIHFFLFSLIDKSLESQMNEVVLSFEPVCMPLFYLLLNIRRN